METLLLVLVSFKKFYQYPFQIVCLSYRAVRFIETIVLLDFSLPLSISVTKTTARLERDSTV